MLQGSFLFVGDLKVKTDNLDLFHAAFGAIAVVTMVYAAVLIGEHVKLTTNQSWSCWLFKGAVITDGIGIIAFCLSFLFGFKNEVRLDDRELLEKKKKDLFIYNGCVLEYIHKDTVDKISNIAVEEGYAAHLMDVHYKYTQLLNVISGLLLIVSIILFGLGVLFW